MNNTLRAIFFDLDGTLLDTDDVIFASFLHVFSRYLPTKKWTREEQLQWLGPSLDQTFSRFLPLELVSQAVIEYRDHNTVHQKEYVHLFPYVRETLEALSQAGLKIVLVTSKTIHASKIGLDLFGLTAYFDCMIGYDEVRHHKPHPEAMVLALQTLQLRPHEVLMIGDSASDIEAAQRAGIRSLGVAWATKGAQLLLDAGAVGLIHRMDDLLLYLS